MSGGSGTPLVVTPPVVLETCVLQLLLVLLAKPGQQPLHGATQSVLPVGIHRGESHRPGLGGLDVPPDRRLDEPTQVTLIVNVNLRSAELRSWATKNVAQLVQVLLEHQIASRLNLQKLSEVECHLQFRKKIKLVR